MFVASLGNGHDVGLISPLSEKTGPGFEGRDCGDLCRRVLLHCSGNLAQSFTSASTQSPERLFLDPVGQNPNYKMTTKLLRRSGLKELVPKGR
jgi:hypothetical protein